ncbi:dnaJ homolog subfamily C member 27 [Vidua macroura]|uniref:dnaJ homolog subfamily C member 27 n=1 Tax=Vidua macroura TaxID=187451 RepID=UPI0023A7CDE2|nr:dnaJ homolog subfamily C member 27 [Vidua macroura]
MEASAAKRKEPRKALRVKVISMGNAEVGKSCIIKRYCEKRFVPKYLATIGIDYGVTKVQIRDREIKVNIFDMAGHPFFYEVRNEFYRDTQGVLLVYDVGSKESFEALEAWLAEMRRELGPHGAGLDSVVVAVCANKVDAGKLRVVDESEGRLWAESRGFLYWETSAQSGEGIQEMFQVGTPRIPAAIPGGNVGDEMFQVGTPGIPGQNPGGECGRCSRWEFQEMFQVGIPGIQGGISRWESWWEFQEMFQVRTPGIPGRNPRWECGR